MTEPIDEALTRLEQAWAQCQRRKEALPRSIGISDPKRLASIVEQECRSQEAVDQACMQWAKDDVWPQMDADTACLVFARFEQALVFGRWIHGRVAFPQKSVADVLVFLLVDYWLSFGRGIWGVQMRDFVR